MVNQPRKVSEEPIASSIGENDRFVILYAANTTTPSLRTISSNNVMRTAFIGLPVYTSNTEAIANSEPLGSMYVTPDGTLKIVI